MTCTAAVQSLTFDEILNQALEEEQTGLLAFDVGGSRTRAYLIDGYIVAVATDEPTFDLGRFLVAAEVLVTEKLVPALRLTKRSGKRLDEVLLVSGAVEAEVLERCRSEHAAEILLSLELYGAPDCDFEPGVLPEDVSGDLALDIEALLQERKRRLGRTAQLIALLRQSDQLVARTSVNGCPVGRDEPAMLNLIDGRRTMEQLCVESGLGRWRTLDALSGLYAQGLIILRQAHDPDPEDWLDLKSDLEDAFSTQAIRPDRLDTSIGGPLSEEPEEPEQEAWRWLNLADENLDAGLYDKCQLAFEQAQQADPGNPAVTAAVLQARERLGDVLRDREFPPGSQLRVNGESSSQELIQDEADLLESLSCRPDVDALLADSGPEEVDLLLRLKRLRDAGVLVAV